MPAAKLNKKSPLLGSKVKFDNKMLAILITVVIVICGVVYYIAANAAIAGVSFHDGGCIVKVSGAPTYNLMVSISTAGRGTAKTYTVPKSGSLSVNTGAPKGWTVTTQLYKSRAGGSQSTKATKNCTAPAGKR